MTYRFDSADKDAQAAIRRIGCAQIDKALAALDDQHQPVAARIHGFRKRCKKLRGLIRIVRPVFADYSRENAAFRDAARKFSFLRDAASLAAAYDRLVEAYDDQIDRRAFGSIRRRLTLRRKKLEEQGASRPIEEARAMLAQARERAESWKIKKDGMDAIAGGVAKTYARARKGMRRANEARDAKALHQWRKRTKYHWLHARLLRPIWIGPMEAHADEAKRLSDRLGEHHDLAVLAEALRKDPQAFGGPKDLATFGALMSQRRAALEAEAFLLGARLFAEPGAALVERWSNYWSVWSDGARTAPQRKAA